MALLLKSRIQTKNSNFCVSETTQNLLKAYCNRLQMKRHYHAFEPRSAMVICSFKLLLMSYANLCACKDGPTVFVEVPF